MLLRILDCYSLSPDLPNWMWYSALIRINDQVGQIHQEFRLTPGQSAALRARVRRRDLHKPTAHVCFSYRVTVPTQKIIQPFTLEANGKRPVTDQLLTFKAYWIYLLYTTFHFCHDLVNTAYKYTSITSIVTLNPSI